MLAQIGIASDFARQSMRKKDFAFFKSLEVDSFLSDPGVVHHHQKDHLPCAFANENVT